MKQTILNPAANPNAVVFNAATRCRVCGRGLRTQPWASLRIGPQCAFRSGEHAGLVRMLRNTRSSGSFNVIEEPDPVAALAKIGMTPEQISRVDVPKLTLKVAEMGAAVKQFTAFDRLSKKSAAAGKASSGSRQSIECFDSSVMRWWESSKDADPAMTLKSTAGVVCAALQASALSSSAFVELGDDEIIRFEASLYRSSLTETLVASRLYGHMVKAKRNALRGDNGQYLLSFLNSGNAIVNGSGRAEINYAALTRDVIREAGEGSRKAKAIFCGLEKHLGEDTALTAVHWLDDMNVRGSQVGVFWNLAVGRNVSPKDGTALMTFMESLYGAADLVDRLNEATRKTGIQHVAVVGGAQMGHRPVLATEKSATNGSAPAVAAVHLTAPELGQAAGIEQRA
jgi:hypothetical protein